MYTPAREASTRKHARTYPSTPNNHTHAPTHELDAHAHVHLFTMDAARIPAFLLSKADRGAVPPAGRGRRRLALPSRDARRTGAACCPGRFPVCRCVRAHAGAPATQRLRRGPRRQDQACTRRACARKTHWPMHPIRTHTRGNRAQVYLTLDDIDVLTEGLCDRRGRLHLPQVRQQRCEKASLKWVVCKCVLEGARVRARACVLVRTIEGSGPSQQGRLQVVCNQKNKPVGRESEFKTKTTRET